VEACEDSATQNGQPGKCTTVSSAPKVEIEHSDTQRRVFVHNSALTSQSATRAIFRATAAAVIGANTITSRSSANHHLQRHAISKPSSAIPTGSPQHQVLHATRNSIAPRGQSRHLPLKRSWTNYNLKDKVNIPNINFKNSKGFKIKHICILNTLGRSAKFVLNGLTVNLQCNFLAVPFGKGRGFDSR
jgi:hypothetical protein